MPTKNPAKSERAISRRAKEFFKRTRTYAPGLNALLTAVRPLGEVVAFGGLLRNAALFGLSDFRSDIDLVVALSNEEALKDVLHTFRPSRTAFGGYRFRVDSFQVDIWPLESTWAFREGLVKDVSIPNLVRTTFFNWDAIAFSLDSGRLFHREDYLDHVAKRFLDVVLAQNPNPFGMAVRTIKLLRHTSAALSPTLVRFIVDVLENPKEGPAGARHSSRWEYQSLCAIAPLLKEHQAVSPHTALCVDWQMKFWGK